MATTRRSPRAGPVSEPVHGIRTADAALDAHRAAGEGHRRVDRLVHRLHAARAARPSHRTSSVTAPGSVSPTRPTSRSSSCSPSSSRRPIRSRAPRRRSWLRSPTSGIELTRHDAIDEMARDGRGRRLPRHAGRRRCRRRSATSACCYDPDGNTVEFSYDQGVYAKAKEVWGVVTRAARSRRGTSARSPAPTPTTSPRG